jgi:F-type H+-transporting ATPase subunit epsilon
VIKLKIVTPERVLLERQADSVTVPTQTGQLTILSNHVPLVSSLKPGELKFRLGNEEEFFAVSGGFLEVRAGNEVVVLADTAEFGHEIDEERAKKAREDAKKLMEQGRLDSTASAEAAALLERNLARLHVARKHRTRTNRNLESGVLHE